MSIISIGTVVVVGVVPGAVVVAVVVVVVKGAPQLPEENEPFGEHG